MRWEVFREGRRLYACAGFIRRLGPFGSYAAARREAQRANQEERVKQAAGVLYEACWDALQALASASDVQGGGTVTLLRTTVERLRRQLGSAIDAVPRGRGGERFSVTRAVDVEDMEVDQAAADSSPGSDPPTAA